MILNKSFDSGKDSFNQHPYIINICCNDVDHLSESMKGWGVTLTQLNQGRFRGDLTLIGQGDLQIYKFQLQPAVQVIGNKLSDCWIFSVPLHSWAQPIYSHGMVLPSDCIFGFDDQREVRLITSVQEFHLGCIAVSKALFQTYAARTGCYELDEAFMQRNVIVPAWNRFTPLVCYLQQLFLANQQQPEFVHHSLNTRLLERDLLPLLVNALHLREDAGLPRPYPRADIVDAAQTFMETNLQRPLTLDDICQAVHASRRSVQYGFQEMFGIGPMVFLKILRLHAIRRILLNAESKNLKVTEVARTWGFWSLGHFSRDYKNLFGESPSQTLAK
jgi:AraC family ethanolamine operon transcriptional activator